MFRMNWRPERQKTVRNRWETTCSHINLRWWLLWREDTFRWHSGRMERTWCLIQCGEARSKAFQLRQLVNYGIINRRGNVKGLREHNFVWCMWSSKCSQPNHIEKLRRSLEVGISSLKTRGRRFRLDLINYGYLETESISGWDSSMRDMEWEKGARRKPWGLRVSKGWGRKNTWRCIEWWGRMFRR